ncbi:OFA family MFS transporter [Salinisphaera sp. Q1T1-3]|uniref:L-lactate MFS transporter n=1 Tax=Salinisphaera sp. Q1T1-3 TaxID=2321229 RepID=UPI000E753163|nr:OFA family MFS transporter [Salinisphaera sp. Q1T1-3]RJS91928.1 MFS transporter [Salinisphaera sp. Q1T1-3]
MAGFFDKSRIVARPGFNRWMVPPAALCIHLCIGQVYAFSVFKIPLTRIIGVNESAAADWDQATLAWIFSLAIAALGLAAAFGGQWLERVGPRKAMALAAACFGGGFIVAAFGVWWHQIWLIYLGYGVIGGIGLGIGYISPVSTLIKWFPDRPGLATGMAIMGFGGGAMIGSPLATNLMAFFASPTSAGVGATFITMGVIYFIFMMIGALIVRIPAAGWQPAGHDPDAADRKQNKMITRNHVHVNQAMKTPQFYLIWLVLFLNVTAGIALLEQASPMAQEMVGTSAAAAAGFVGVLSIFNMAGRFFWASTSDTIGRKPTYAVFFILGMLLYAVVPSVAAGGSIVLFVLACCVIVSMYGGGFATVPAYLKDIFGTMHVGAIHGRLLTAWAAAGVVGPVLLNELREGRIAAGVPPADAYTTTLYIMVALLGLGLICNLLVRPVADKHHYAGEINEVA